MTTAAEIIKVSEAITISPWDNPDLGYIYGLIMQDKLVRLPPVLKENSFYWLIQEKIDDTLIRLGCAYFEKTASLRPFGRHYGYLLHYYRDEKAFARRKYSSMTALVAAAKLVDFFFDEFQEPALYITQDTRNKGSILLCKKLGFARIGEGKDILDNNLTLNVWVKERL